VLALCRHRVPGDVFFDVPPTFVRSSVPYMMGDANISVQDQGTGEYLATSPLKI